MGRRGRPRAEPGPVPQLGESHPVRQKRTAARVAVVLFCIPVGDSNGSASAAAEANLAELRHKRKRFCLPRLKRFLLDIIIGVWYSRLDKTGCKRGFAVEYKVNDPV